MQKSLFYGLFAVAMMLMCNTTYGMHYAKDAALGIRVGVTTSLAAGYTFGYTKGIVEKIPALANVLPYTKWLSLAAVVVSGLFEFQGLAEEVKAAKDMDKKNTSLVTTLCIVAQRVVCKALPSFILNGGYIALCNRLVK